MVQVTKHGTKRVKERIGVSKKIADRIAEKALEKGLKHCEVNGSLRRYLDHVFLSHGNANNIRIYGRNVFLFHDNILITVLDLPKEYYSTVDNIKNKITRN